MALTRKEVEEIALLARLSLAPEELDRLQGELGAILSHFEAISAVDTDGVPAMTHAVPMDLRLRPDVAQPSMDPHTALSGAPRRDGDLFVVPSSIAPPARAGAGAEPARSAPAAAVAPPVGASSPVALAAGTPSPAAVAPRVDAPVVVAPAPAAAATVAPAVAAPAAPAPAQTDGVPEPVSTKVVTAPSAAPPPPKGRTP